MPNVHLGTQKCKVGSLASLVRLGALLGQEPLRIRQVRLSWSCAPLYAAQCRFGNEHLNHTWQDGQDLLISDARDRVKDMHGLQETCFLAPGHCTLLSTPPFSTPYPHLPLSIYPSQIFSQKKNASSPLTILPILVIHVLLETCII